VVTLDPKENFCGCGGRGHLEGILGRRSMRMRFLDLEPEEVFRKCSTVTHAVPNFVIVCVTALWPLHRHQHPPWRGPECFL